ncbi:hypothetical protein [Aquimarina sp. SS2-1]|uniref:hypothetical protein n=1 Tax=Aquimarina besae TaxID=3342247 RepID=UPI00366F5060
MKKQVRLQPFLVVLASVLLCLSACQKDDVTTIEDTSVNQKGTIVNTVSVSDVPALQNFMATKMNGLPQKSAGSGSYVETSFGKIPLENVMEVIDIDDNTNYTFKIYPDNPTPHTFYNLIVNPSKDGSDPVALVLEYKMTKEFASDLFFGRKRIDEFEGEINKYSLDTFINQGISKSVDLPCPCAEVNVSSDTSNTLGGGFGGGSGSGTDDSDPDNTGESGDPYTGGTSTGGTNGGGGGCKIRVVLECSGGSRDLPPDWPQGPICVTTGIFIDCPASKSNIAKTEDCPITDTGDCPNTTGEFGINELDLVEFLEITDFKVRFALFFDANQDLVNTMGNFLWRFKSDATTVEIAREANNEIAEDFAYEEITKEQAIAIINSEEFLTQITVQIEDPCQKLIVADAKNVNSDINTLLFSIFDTDNSKVDLQYIEDDLNELGTTGIYPDCSSGRCLYTVRLDKDYLSQGTDLSIVTTVIHENIHAILSFAAHNNLLDYNEDATLAELAEVYAIFMASTDVLQIRETGDTTVDLQHKYIANLVEQISNAAKIYGEQRGYDFDDDFYDAIAWTGLTGIESFHEIIQEEEKRDEIIAILIAEESNEPSEYGSASATPKGSPASEYEECE